MVKVLRPTSNCEGDWLYTCVMKCADLRRALGKRQDVTKHHVERCQHARTCTPVQSLTSPSPLTTLHITTARRACDEAQLFALSIPITGGLTHKILGPDRVTKFY